MVQSYNDNLPKNNAINHEQSFYIEEESMVLQNDKTVVKIDLDSLLTD